ncbi:MAG: DNA helicase UvrD, partial [Chloroflexi bacterium]|nr:DNA helicase UvrD [Chloroflexota bacterium]
ASKGVQQEYLHVVRELGGELRVLAHAGAADLEAAAGERMAQGILKARLGDVTVEPGYDGVYGTVRVWPDAPPTR